jgi:hypothetical protein
MMRTREERLSTLFSFLFSFDRNSSRAAVDGKIRQKDMMHGSECSSDKTLVSGWRGENE